MRAIVDRRRLLRGSAILGSLNALGLAGCATAPPPAAPETVRLAPVRARADRIFDITVCTRPFRAAGPRLDAEQLGDCRVVHNYGHGGSGWSLSWGSSTIAVRKAMASSPRAIAVLGCGVLGLTSSGTPARSAPPAAGRPTRASLLPAPPRPASPPSGKRWPAPRS